MVVVFCARIPLRAANRRKPAMSSGEDVRTETSRRRTTDPVGAVAVREPRRIDWSLS
jgi:hypothetical protein